MQGYDENLEVVRLRISGASETLQGYNYFWIRAVEGFDPKEHCAKCIRGGWKLLKQNRMKLNQPVELRMKRVGYICGETFSRNLHPGQKPHTLPMPGGAITYTKNLHLPFEKAPGHVEEVTLVEGQTLTLFNGRRLDFPSLPEWWAGLGDEFTTCRNFQFAVHYFGFSEQTVRAAHNGA